MASRFTKNDQSLFHKVVLGLMVLSLAGVCSIPVVLYELHKRKTWAVSINGYTVLEKELLREVHDKKRWVEQLKSEYGAPFIDALGAQANPSALALESIIRDNLYHELADKMGTRITTSFVAFLLKNQQFVVHYLFSLIPRAVFDAATNTINTERLKDYLTVIGLKPHDFEKKIELIAFKKCVNTLVAGGVYVPSYVHKSMRIAQSYDKKYEVLVFKESDFVAREEKENPQDMREAERFFEEKKQLYARPEQRAGYAWYFHPETYGIEITDEENKEYYEKYKQEKFRDKPVRVDVLKVAIAYTPETKDSARQVLEDFLNQKEEEEKSSDKITYDTLTISRGTLNDAELESAVLRLKNSGDPTQIFDRDNHWLYYVRRARHPQTYQAWEDVAEKIDATLMARRLKNRFSGDAALVTRGDSDLKSFVKQHRGNKKDIPLTARESAADKEKDVRNALFSLKNEGDRIAFITGDTGVIVELTERQESVVPSFDDVRGIVKHDLSVQKGRERLRHDIMRARNIFYTMSGKDVADEYHPSDIFVTDFIGHNRECTLEYPELHCDDIEHMTHRGEIKIVARNGFIFLVKLQEIRPAEEKTDESNASIRNAYAEEIRTTVTSLIASLYRNAKIDVQAHFITNEKELPYER